MAGARYVVLQLRESQPGVGFRAIDRISGDELFLIDQQISRTVATGGCLAGRVLAMPELHMLSGAELPVPAEALGAVVELAEELRRVAGGGPGRLPPGVELDFAEIITGTLLDAGAAEGIAYVQA